MAEDKAEPKEAKDPKEKKEKKEKKEERKEVVPKTTNLGDTATIKRILDDAAIKVCPWPHLTVTGAE